MSTETQEEFHARKTRELDEQMAMAEDYDPRSIEGDFVNVSCADGVRRDLEISEVTSPGLRWLVGDRMHRVWTEDGRQIVHMPDGYGWCEGVAY